MALSNSDWMPWVISQNDSILWGPSSTSFHLSSSGLSNCLSLSNSFSVCLLQPSTLEDFRLFKVEIVFFRSLLLQAVLTPLTLKEVSRAFSRKWSMSPLLMLALALAERESSHSMPVGRSFGSVKSSCHGSKHLSTGGTTTILTEMLLY